MMCLKENTDRSKTWRYFIMIMNKTELLLNEGWKFHFGECEEAWYQGYDDRAFERVMLPHDWAVAYPFSKAPDI